MEDTQQNGPEMEQISTTEASGQKSLGPIIGIIIIVLVLVIGGFLIYGKSVKNNVEKGASLSNEENSADIAQIENINAQSSSDTPEDILKDLESVPPTNLNSGIETF